MILDILLIVVMRLWIWYQKWLPKEQSAEGSQNVDVEILVDGYNDCLKEIREMLR
jgi:hypothetical protein